MNTPGTIYDMIGIGFGPANLALAVACEEASERRSLRSLFLEVKPEFAWLPGIATQNPFGPGVYLDPISKTPQSFWPTLGQIPNSLCRRATQ